MADWEGVTDVNALKTMLAAQQAQLQALRGKENSNPKDNRKRKSTANNVESYELGDISDEEQAQADSEDYTPENDSDYDAPKKSSSKKKKANSSSSKAKKGRRTAADTDSEDEDIRPAATSAQITKAAAAALRSIKSTVNAQMVYKPSIKHGRGRVGLELPCLSLAVIQHMLGPNMVAKASNGKKQLQLKATEDDLSEMFESKWGSPFGKSLRYGATLSLQEGLTFTYNKGTETLKVHGFYVMVK